MNAHEDQPPYSIEQRLAQVRLVREEREASLKMARDLSRQIVLEAITEEGISVAKASEISGHNRATVTTWLQIHNAEKKGRAEGK